MLKNVSAVAAAFGLLIALSIPSGIHKVKEGHVGVYFLGGALLQSITEPGYHYTMPYITSWQQIQVTLQTDVVRNIPCGTSGGVMIDFEKIEVVNRLEKAAVYQTIKNYTTNYDRIWIYDKIHHEINQFCSVHTLQEIYIEIFEQLDESLVQALQKILDEWAPGIQIMSIRVTKPKIPVDLQKEFEKMEAEKSSLRKVTEKEKVILQEAETDRKKALIDATKKLEVARIGAEKDLNEQQSKLEVARIENEILLSREKAFADAVYYSAEQEARGNEELLTESFLNLTYVRSLTKNAHFILGSNIPDTFYLGSGIDQPLSNAKPKHV